MSPTFALTLFVLLVGSGPTKPSVFEPLRIKLPFPKGTTFQCTQGWHGKASHSDGINDFACDFTMPEGTPVVAAAAGRVLVVKQDSKVGGTSRDMIPLGNIVWIDHGGGRFGLYEHLQFGSVPVRVGELVNAGRVIGLSGSTGFAAGPHLHFCITDFNRRSTGCPFQDVEGDGIPVEGQSYESGNDGHGASWFSGDSNLAPDFFAGSGIALDSQTPAVYLDNDVVYVLKGSVTKPCKSVRIFFSLFGQPGPIAGKSIQVAADQSFQIPLRLADFDAQFKDLGPFQYGISSVDENGHYWCAAMVGLVPRRDEVDEQGKRVVHMGLPFRKGEHHKFKRISTGQDDGSVVLAFTAPVKTPVLAGAEGRVISIRPDSGASRAKNAKSAATSSITIDHGEGVTTEYSGLAPDSIAVREGEIVERGQALGASSTSSLAGGPGFGFSARVQQRTARTPMLEDMAPGSSEAEEATSSGTGSDGHVFQSDSLAASDAFVQNGIDTVAGSPAFTYHDSVDYVIEGTVAGPSARVAFLVRKRGQAKCCTRFVTATEAHAFRLGVRLADRSKDLGTGPWDWAVTAADDVNPSTAVAWQPLTLMR